MHRKPADTASIWACTVFLKKIGQKIFLKSGGSVWPKRRKFLCPIFLRNTVGLLCCALLRGGCPCGCTGAHTGGCRSGQFSGGLYSKTDFARVIRTGLGTTRNRFKPVNLWSGRAVSATHLAKQKNSRSALPGPGKFRISAFKFPVAAAYFTAQYRPTQAI